jgi:hypothetical protein
MEGYTDAILACNQQLHDSGFYVHEEVQVSILLTGLGTVYESPKDTVERVLPVLVN